MVLPNDGFRRLLGPSVNNINLAIKRVSETVTGLCAADIEEQIANVANQATGVLSG
jgi:hypothetical protein